MCLLSFMNEAHIGNTYRSHPECAGIGNLLEGGHSRKGWLLVWCLMPGVGPGLFSSLWEDPRGGADWEEQSRRVSPGGTACGPACVAVAKLLQGL